MRAHSGDVADGVIAAEGDRGQALAAIGGVNGLQLDGLVLEVLVVLAALVSDSPDFFRGLRGQISVRSGIGEGDILARRYSDFALQQDEVFFEGGFGVDADLLLRLQLDAGAEFVEVGDGSGQMGFVRVVELDLIFGFEGLGVVHFAGGGDGVGEERTEFADDAGVEALGGQVVLVDAGRAGEDEGGQELLEGFVLFTFKRLLAVFGFLEAEIVLEAEGDGFVERELEGVVGGGMRCDAAIKGVGCGGRIGRLGAKRHGGKGQGQAGQQDRLPQVKMGRSIH